MRSGDVSLWLLRHRSRRGRELVLGHVELDVEVLQLLGVDGVRRVDHRRDAAPEAAHDDRTGSAGPATKSATLDTINDRVDERLSLRNPVQQLSRFRFEEDVVIALVPIIE